jgi:aryl-alcohol dehydrogenase-like predicted oxidoreductase
MTTEEEITKSLRRRMNLTISTKGVITWDTTVDGVGYSLEELTTELDAQVKALVARSATPGDLQQGA